MLSFSLSPSASTARTTTGTASAKPLLKSLTKVLIHATGVETLLCPASSCCRARTCERTGSASLRARQLHQPCAYYSRSHHQGLDWLWDAVSAPEHIQACWTWVLGPQHLSCSRHPCGFPLEAKDLHLVCSWCPEWLAVQQLNQALHPATKTCALLLSSCSVLLLLES